MSAKRTQPSDRQQEIADAVRAHGSMAAAAKAIGRTRQTVETTLARYHERVCDRRIEAARGRTRRATRTRQQADRCRTTARGLSREPPPDRGWRDRRAEGEASGSRSVLMRPSPPESLAGVSDRLRRVGSMATHPCPGCLRVTSRAGRCLACGGGTTTQRGYGADVAYAAGPAAAAASAVPVGRDAAVDHVPAPRDRRRPHRARRSTAARTTRPTSRALRYAPSSGRRASTTLIRSADGSPSESVSSTPDPASRRCRSRKARFP